MTATWRALAPGEVDHERLWLLVTLALAAAVLLADVAGGLDVGSCLLKIATGIPCPTCGATRALLALRTGHPADALAWNPLVTVAALAGAAYLAYAAWVLAFRRLRYRVRLSARDWTILRVTTALLVGANWIYLLVAGR
jgi:Protein of unknown function (DUF2752)